MNSSLPSPQSSNEELVVLKKRLEDINGELGAFRNFGLSEYTFVIMGWNPKKIHTTHPVGSQASFW